MEDDDVSGLHFRNRLKRGVEWQKGYTTESNFRLHIYPAAFFRGPGCASRHADAQLVHRDVQVAASLGDVARARVRAEAMADEGEEGVVENVAGTTRVSAAHAGRAGAKSGRPTYRYWRVRSGTE